MSNALSDADNEVATQAALRIIDILSKMEDATSGEIELWGRIAALQKATAGIVAAYAAVNGAGKVPMKQLLRAYETTLQEAVESGTELVQFQQ